MEKYKVNLLLNAEQDLIDIYNYISENDSVNKAETLLDKIEELCFSLENFPERGHVPEELKRLSIHNYREIHFKSYRVLYQIDSKEVYIHCVIDGRRDLESILLRKLLR